LALLKGLLENFRLLRLESSDFGALTALDLIREFEISEYRYLFEIGSLQLISFDHLIKFRIGRQAYNHSQRGTVLEAERCPKRRAFSKQTKKKSQEIIDC